MQNNNLFTKLRYIILTGLVLGMMSCDDGCDDNGNAQPDAEIVDNILSTQITGSADDADRTTPADRYTGPNDLDAVDKRTKASSLKPKFNEVSGKAEAEPLDPAANTVTGDETVARSLNKVVSQFKVNKDGRFTFDIDIDIDKVVLRHDGTVTVQVVASMLKNDGTSVQNGGIANLTLEFKRNKKDSIEVIIAGDTANPDKVTVNGDYNRTLSGPNGGIALTAGNYRLEFDLRIIARAPVQVGNDGQRHRGAVDNAKATIKLR